MLLKESEIREIVRCVLQEELTYKPIDDAIPSDEEWWNALKNLALKRLYRKLAITVGPIVASILILPPAEYEVDFSKVPGPLADRASALYNELFAGLNNKNLAIAIIANAEAESNIRANNNGDAGDYANSHPNKAIDTSRYPRRFVHPERGLSCAFGIFQYNICAGLGIDLLDYYLPDGGTDAQKVDILTDWDQQVEFMIKHVKEMGVDTNDPRTVPEWTEWFMKEVENPQNQSDEKVAERQAIAAKYMVQIEVEEVLEPEEEEVEEDIEPEEEEP